MWERGYSKKKKGEREKQELFSKIPSLSGYFTKADDGVEVVEQQVDGDM